MSSTDKTTPQSKAMAQSLTTKQPPFQLVHDWKNILRAHFLSTGLKIRQGAEAMIYPVDWKGNGTLLARFTGMSYRFISGSLIIKGAKKKRKAYTPKTKKNFVEIGRAKPKASVKGALGKVLGDKSLVEAQRHENRARELAARDQELVEEVSWRLTVYSYYLKHEFLDQKKGLLEQLLENPLAVWASMCVAKLPQWGYEWAKDPIGDVMAKEFFAAVEAQVKELKQVMSEETYGQLLTLINRIASGYNVDLEHAFKWLNKVARPYDFSYQPLSSHIWEDYWEMVAEHSPEPIIKFEDKFEKRSDIDPLEMANIIGAMGNVHPDFSIKLF